MTEPEREQEEDGFDYGETLVVQHATATGPSALTEVLDARAGRRPWRLVDVASGAPFPSLDSARGIILLGGPMAVGDSKAHPWLAGEQEAVAAALQREIAVFGICLGAQLLASVLGGEVGSRAVPEVGFLPLERTEVGRTDRVFAGWADGAATLFFHDDEVVRMPVGAETMLVGSDGTSAWRAPDGRSYGVQFHPEVDAAQVAAWCSTDHNRDRCHRAGVDPDALAVEAQRRDRFVRAVGLTLVGRWLDAVVGHGDPDPTRGRRAR
ncbi:MAG TPA: type 1 glutamine amidotransferase [Nitriliruptorales bacterium]|nr:type 1 glutamine amidotransferase [Nitriliruptorales bacterium]